MAKLTLAKYKQLCKDYSSDSEGDGFNESELFDIAEGMLSVVPGLKEFIQKEFGASDVKGRLADDLSCE